MYVLTYLFNILWHVIYSNILSSRSNYLKRFKLFARHPVRIEHSRVKSIHIFWAAELSNFLQNCTCNFPSYLLPDNSKEEEKKRKNRKKEKESGHSLPVYQASYDIWMDSLKVRKIDTRTVSRVKVTVILRSGGKKSPAIHWQFQ